jgi:hypothetical protein
MAQGWLNVNLLPWLETRHFVSQMPTHDLTHFGVSWSVAILRRQAQLGPAWRKLNLGRVEGHDGRIIRVSSENATTLCSFTPPQITRPSTTAARGSSLRAVRTCPQPTRHRHKPAPSRKTRMRSGWDGLSDSYSPTYFSKLMKCFNA